MASCVAVNALQPEPSPAQHGLRRVARFPGESPWRAARRWRAQLRVGEQALGECLGARACVWFSRTTALGFAGAALFAAQPLPGTLDVILRMALLTLSWCAGLAALSAAGPAPELMLHAGRGLWLNRGMSWASLRAEQPFASALWILRHIGAATLLVGAVCVGASSELGLAAQLFGVTLGALGYVVALAVGLAVLAHLCHLLGQTRGRALLLAVVFIPELIAPVWPSLPTLISNYSHLLDACLSVGARL
jgi:hypothetical protein